MLAKTGLILFLIVITFLSYNFLMSRDNSTPQVTGFAGAGSNLYKNFTNTIGLSGKKGDELEKIITDYAQRADFTLGVGIKNIDTGEEYYLNGDVPFISASLYKLVVMYGVFYEGRNGRLDVTDSQIQSQLDNMISVSSNEAAVALAERIGWDKLDSIAKSIGLKNTSLYSPITTTPEDITNLLYLIANGRALDPENSLAMKNLLLNQKINDRIPRLLPPEVKVGHKTGELDDVRHDAGIVYGPKNTYIITLMSKEITSEEATKDLMAQLSLAIYQYFED